MTDAATQNRQRALALEVELSAGPLRARPGGPLGRSAVQDDPLGPSSFVQGLGTSADTLLEELRAAGQRVRPIGLDRNGNIDRELAPEPEQAFFREMGQPRLSSEHVVLRDPRDGAMKVFMRSPESSTSRMDAIGRILSFGTLASPAVQTVGRMLKPGPIGQTVEAFERAGVEPTVTGVTGGEGAIGRTVGLLDRAASEAPVTGGIVERGRTRSLDQTQQAVENIAEQFGGATTRQGAGEGVQEGLARFAGPVAPGAKIPTLSEVRKAKAGQFGFKLKAAALYEDFAKRLPDGTEVPATNARSAITAASQRFDNPELAAKFANSDLAAWAEILDNAGGRLSLNDLRNLRTEIGDKLTESVVLKGVRDAQLDSVYAGLTKDIKAAAQAAGPGVSRSFQRANDFYAAGVNRIEKAFGKFLGKTVTEGGAFARILDLASETGRGASVKILNQIRRSVSPDEWGDVGAVVLRNLGRNNQEPFSVSTFFTNWSKLSKQGKDVLFNVAENSPTRRALDELVNVVIKNQRNVERLKNTSGTARQLLTGGMVVAAYADFFQTLSVAAGGGAVALALTSPKFLRFMSTVGRRGTGTSAAQLAPLISRGRALVTNDPRLAPAVDALLQSVTGSEQEE